ncbi:MAG TPA: hypothetical protein ENI64_03625 [Gammaproteobacteria bacterium]|nr:hypothetical protein [Gammaproteobacteria bacterium]
MKTKFLIFLLTIFSGLIFTGTASAGNSQLAYAPDEVLVKYKETTTAAVANNINATTIKYFKQSKIYHLKLPKGMSVEAAISLLQQDPKVAYAVPNNIYYLNQLPNDTFFTQMWGLNNTGQTGGTSGADISAALAWDITTGSSGVVVAVLDTGMELNHADLAANLWVNPGEIAGNGIDDDGNGFIDDVNGWNFANNSNDPSPTGGSCGGHGTHTAGTVGAVGNNGIGVSGVSWTVQIMPLNIFTLINGTSCGAFSSDILAAIGYYTMMNVRISSNSYGGGGYNQAVSDAIMASNSLFVVAAGNDGLDNDTTPSYPSSYPLINILSVAATDANDLLASFSNFGTLSTDIAAPGVSILSTGVNSTYTIKSGTSMSTPHVAGAAALLLAQDPNLTIQEMKWRLMNGVDNLALPVASGGRMNIFTSLQYGQSLPDVSVTMTPVGSTDIRGGDIIYYQIQFTNNTANTINAASMVYLQTVTGFGSLDGATLILAGPITLSLPPGISPVSTLGWALPSGVAIGSSFSLYGVTTPGSSFDEDKITYTIVP